MKSPVQSLRIEGSSAPEPTENALWLLHASLGNVEVFLTPDQVGSI